MRHKLFTDTGYVFFDNKAMKGWHKCANLKEYAAWVGATGEAKCEPCLNWTGAPIPEDIMADVLALIKANSKIEIMICLYYNNEEGKWLADCPKQNGGGASVSYDSDYKPPVGYVFCGTIHSHPRMPAFWSRIDCNDQGKKNGLHVVIGTDNEGNMSSWKCALWFNGQCYDSKAVLIPEKISEKVPEEWLSKIGTLKNNSATVTVVKEAYEAGHKKETQSPEYRADSILYVIRSLRSMKQDKSADYILSHLSEKDKEYVKTAKINATDSVLDYFDDFEDIWTDLDEVLDDLGYDNMLALSEPSVACDDIDLDDDDIPSKTKAALILKYLEDLGYFELAEYAEAVMYPDFSSSECVDASCVDTSDSELIDAEYRSGVEP